MWSVYPIITEASYFATLILYYLTIKKRHTHAADHTNFNVFECKSALSKLSHFVAMPKLGVVYVLFVPWL